MTKKMFEKLRAKCIANEKDELKKLVGKELADEDIELVDSICNAILDLRNKYELGNFEDRDYADEINAIMPLMHQLLAADDLYACKVSA